MGIKLLPLWLRSLGIGHVRAISPERLLELYHQFQAGKTRFLIAFRHPTSDDPICLSYLLAHIVPQVARQHSISLRHPIDAHFWAGATSIHQSKCDRAGLQKARHLFANGSLPIAAAPEGTINGLSDRVNPLESGVARLAFWCLEDLLSAGRFEQVVILPVGIKYRYVRTSWQVLETLLKRLEKESGLSVNDSSMLPIIPCPEQRIFGRLMRLTEFWSQLEDFNLTVSIANYVREKPTFERLAESTLLLGRAIACIQGGSKLSYRHPGQRRVEITVGEAISVSQRWDAYRTNHRQAVETLTKDLQTALKATIFQPTTEIEKVLLVN